MCVKFHQQTKMSIVKYAIKLHSFLMISVFTGFKTTITKNTYKSLKDCFEKEVENSLNDHQKSYQNSTKYQSKFDPNIDRKSTSPKWAQPDRPSVEY